jgi:sugar/nucleoside kinase (ribokinase family)
MRPLAVIGNVNVDLIMGPVTPWPTPGTENLVAHDEMRAGGAAGNVALAWQALGVRFQSAASVGNDQFGRFLQDAFAGIGGRWPVTDTPTTVSLGLTHPDGERTFFCTTGHLPQMTVDEALSCIDAEQLRGGLMLLCGSFVMPGLADGYDALFSWAAERAVDIALDTGWPPAGWDEETIARTKRWLAHCRHLLLNEVEAAALAGVDHPETAARTLAAGMAGGESVAVVKRGPDGALACSSRGEVVAIPAMEIVLVDSIGAGDVFNAGYLVAVASGRGLADALRYGVEIASAAISTSPRAYLAANRRAKGQVR